MQQIVRGITVLPKLIADLHCRKLMLVTDASYPALSIWSSIEVLDIAKVRFSDFTPNPLYEQVCQGVNLFLSEGCDALLAIGGGSSIDVAKCIKLACIAEGGKAALIPPLVQQRPTITAVRPFPLIAIPTTAGSGSESTHNAVIYYEGAKQTVTDDSILPDIALLEPSVLHTLPLYQKKCTMMDALCQGIESWWSINSTDESKTYSRNAVERIMAHWRSYIFDNSEEAAWEIMQAANFGGKAINIAQTTAAHAMSYKITSLCKLPHGHAVAICLPEIWAYMNRHPEKCKDTRGTDYMMGIFGEIASAMGASSIEEAIKTFRSMMNEMELKGPVVEHEKEALLETLTLSVNPIRLKNNPVELDSAAIMGLYRNILQS